MPKRKYSRKHRGGGGQCSSLGCKDDEIPDSKKIVMANNFLNQNINNYDYDYAKTNNKNKDSYISVLQKIHKKFPEGIDGNTNLVEAFEKPKAQTDQHLFSSNCNMFRYNLLDRLKNGYMEELKRKEEFIVGLSVVERKLITQQNKEDFKKEFDAATNAAAAAANAATNAAAADANAATNAAAADAATAATAAATAQNKSLYKKNDTSFPPWSPNAIKTSITRKTYGGKKRARRQPK